MRILETTLFSGSNSSRRGYHKRGNQHRCEPHMAVCFLSSSVMPFDFTTITSIVISSHFFMIRLVSGLVQWSDMTQINRTSTKK